MARAIGSQGRGRDADPERRARRRRTRRRAALVLLAFIGVATVIWWSTIAAQVRAVAVVATLLDVPVLEPVVAAVTDDVTHEDVELAGMPARVFQPSGDGPWPAVAFITGADAAGRESEDIAGLGKALARAGYVTIVPELPGLSDGAVSQATLESAGAAVIAAADLPQVRGDRVALVSVSAGASLSILAASSSEVSKHVSVLAGVAPFARVRTVLQIAITGGYVTDDGSVERYVAEGWLREAVAASIFEATSGGPAAEAIERGLLEQDDPIAAAARVEPGSVTDPELRLVLELLRTAEPEQFDARFEALPPDVRGAIDDLSPLVTVGKLDAPLELASSERDRYFPLEESEVLVDAAPNGRLTVTNVLEHASPRPGLGDTGDLLAFNAFVVRVLRTAQERAK